MTFCNFLEPHVTKCRFRIIFSRKPSLSQNNCQQRARYRGTLINLIPIAQLKSVCTISKMVFDLSHVLFNRDQIVTCFAGHTCTCHAYGTTFHPKSINIPNDTISCRLSENIFLDVGMIFTPAFQVAHFCQMTISFAGTLDAPDVHCNKLL